MRVGIASGGEHLPFSSRLQDEGNDVLVWIDPKAHGASRCGKGIVPLAGGWEELFSWVKDTREPAVLLFDMSGMGEKADEARKAGLNVVCGGKFCDRLEKDREFGYKIASEAGMLIPNYETFGTISDAIKYAERLGDQASYFKTDRYIDSDSTYCGKDGYEMVEYLESVRQTHGDRIRCIIQDKIEGVAISTARWFNGKEFVGPFEGTIEHKKLLNDDVGVSTGCAINAVWFYGEESELATRLGWDLLSGVFRENNASPGIYDVNSIVTDEGEAYFLEWCGRLGYDSEPTAQALILDFSRFLWNVATGQGDLGQLGKSIAYSTRLWEPPYPFEANPKETDERKSCVGNHLFGISSLWNTPFVGYGLQACGSHFSMANSSGLVGLSLATGRKLSILNRSVCNYAKTIRPHSLGYRTDGDKVIAEDAKELGKVLGDLPEGLKL